MTTPMQQSDAMPLWDILKKEITGIQLLWETVESLYFEADAHGIVTLAEDVPLLYRLVQTTLMESLLLRVSRLMDPAASGRDGTKSNLSLKRLADACSETALDAQAVRRIWDASNLRRVRDKYLSHNDLTRSLTESHTLNIPLPEADFASMRELAFALREFLRSTQGKLNLGIAYLDEAVNLHVQRETAVINRMLKGSALFFKLLPEHEALQSAWLDAELTTGEEK